MTSKELKALPSGTYVRARISGQPETVLLLGVRAPTERQRSFGYRRNFVDVRRYLVGGYWDTYVWAGDVISTTIPSIREQRVMAYIEREIGPKEKE